MSKHTNLFIESKIKLTISTFVDAALILDVLREVRGQGL